MKWPPYTLEEKLKAKQYYPRERAQLVCQVEVGQNPIDIENLVIDKLAIFSKYRRV